MITKINKEVDGHTLEYRYCCTGSINPWALDWCDEHKISLFVTSDVAYFILVDDDDVYCMRGIGGDFENTDFASFDEAKAWLDKYCDARGSLKECIERIANPKPRKR